MLGPPDTVVELGETEVSEEIFMEYLSSLGESTYRWGCGASQSSCRSIGQRSKFLFFYFVISR